MHDERITDIELRWSASLARTLAACGLGPGLGCGLVALAAGGVRRADAGRARFRHWRHRPPPVAVRAFPGLQRCFEGDEADATIRIRSRPPPPTWSPKCR